MHPTNKQGPATLISVVIPCYNCSSTIARSINSVLQQALPASEIILVDDASTDDSIKVVRQIQRGNPKIVIKVISLGVNGGAARARNLGWEMASCQYVAFLDSDDTWHPDKLSIQSRYMTNNPRTSISGHLINDIESQVNTKDESIDAPIVRILKKNSLLFSNPFSTPTVMVKREVSLRFPENQRYSEDFRLWLSFAFSNHTVVRIERTLAFVHKPLWGHSGLSSHLLKMERGELSNFFNLYIDRKIGAPLMLAATGWSIIKFIRRVISTKVRSKFISPVKPES